MTPEVDIVDLVDIKHQAAMHTQLGDKLLDEEVEPPMLKIVGRQIHRADLMMTKR